MSFTFRFRFLLNKDARIGWEEPELELNLGDDSETFLLKSHNGNTPIKETDHLVLFGSTYSSKERAKQKGELAKKNLILLGAKEQLGIDLGRDKASGGITEAGKEDLRRNSDLEENVKIRNDKLGLDVYPADQETLFFRTHAEATATRAGENFSNDFQKLWENVDEVGQRVKLAAELYNQARRSNSDATRLVATISAVDALTSTQERPEVIINYIDNLVDQVEELEDYLKQESNLSEEEINGEVGRLKTYIGGFRNYSIKQTAKSLISDKIGDNEYCGQDPADFFSDCYILRSSIVHSGPSAVDKDINMKRKANCMDQLARDLILSVINN